MKSDYTIFHHIATSIIERLMKSKVPRIGAARIWFISQNFKFIPDIFGFQVLNRAFIISSRDFQYTYGKE